MSRRSDQRREAVFTVYQHDLTGRPLHDLFDQDAAMFTRSLAHATTDHQDEFVQVCLDGFAVTEDNQAKAQAAIDRGDTVAAVLADTTLAAQGLSQDGTETCVMASDVTNPQLAPAVLQAPVGQWTVAGVTDPTNGNVAVFIRPNKREPLTLDDPTVVQTITTTLQDDATAAAQQALSGEATKMLVSAKVDVNPQYGSWDPEDQALIVAPAVPTQKAAPTTLPVFTGQ